MTDTIGDDPPALADRGGPPLEPDAVARSAVPALAAFSATGFIGAVVLFWSDAPALWCVLLATAGLIMLHLSQLAFLRERLGTVLRSIPADVVSVAAGHTAILLALLQTPVQGRTGASVGLVVVLLTSLALAVIVMGAAVVTPVIAHVAGDARGPWLTAAGLSGAALMALTVLRVADLLPVAFPVFETLAGVLIITLIGVSTTPAPAPGTVSGQRSHPRNDLWIVMGAAAESLVVLLIASQHPVVTPAVVAAVMGMAAVGIKFALLVQELQTLQVTHSAALKDDLTLLPNRLAVQQRIGQLQEDRREAALVVIGLDRFKDVNNVAGRDGGDELLRQIATRLTSHQRHGEFLARHGGDEFAVLMLRGDVDSALMRAGELIELMSTPFSLGARRLHMRPRAGVVSLSPAKEGGTAAEVLLRADVALGAAKSSSARAVVHEESLHAAAQQRIEVGEALHLALAEDQFVLHYQPQVDAGDRVCGVEALVRWQHLPAGLLTPDRFLPLVQELGLQSDLSRWVLSNAVRQAAAWRREGMVLPVSVNLSADDLVPDLVDVIAGELTAWGLPADQLVVELTETTLVTDPEGVAGVLDSLVELGVEVSIDDYGTGYSSLTLLLRLPVKELKIDRSFVTGLLTDARSRVVVEATIQLAHQLGMRVVAEGVEDRDVLSALRAAGCDLTQGWVHHPAVPALDLVRWHQGRVASRDFGTRRFSHRTGR